jgi:hypothetical protein
VCGRCAEAAMRPFRNVPKSPEFLINVAKARCVGGHAIPQSARRPSRIAMILRRRAPAYCPLQAGRSSAPMPVITGPPMSGLSDPGTRRCGPAFDSRVRFAMNGLLIVFAAALMLLLPQFNNADAAGPYEGEWTGTATSTGERCKQAVVKLTVEGQVVLGPARFERDVPNINGTVDEDGAFGATTPAFRSAPGSRLWTISWLRTRATTAIGVQFRSSEHACTFNSRTGVRRSARARAQADDCSGSRAAMLSTLLPRRVHRRKRPCWRRAVTSALGQNRTRRRPYGRA